MGLLQCSQWPKIALVSRFWKSIRKLWCIRRLLYDVAVAVSAFQHTGQQDTHESSCLVARRELCGIYGYLHSFRTVEPIRYYMMVPSKFLTTSEEGKHTYFMTATFCFFTFFCALVQCLVKKHSEATSRYQLNHLSEICITSSWNRPSWHRSILSEFATVVGAAKDVQTQFVAVALLKLRSLAVWMLTFCWITDTFHLMTCGCFPWFSSYDSPQLLEDGYQAESLQLPLFFHHYFTFLLWDESNHMVKINHQPK